MTNDLVASIVPVQEPSVVPMINWRAPAPTVAWEAPRDAVLGAQAGWTRWRVPASVALAQYGIESAWGRFEPKGSNNGFGIQAMAGLPSVSAASHEFRNGKMVEVVEKFAVFQSVADAFYWHAKLLATNKAYVKAMAACSSPDAFALALTGVYATAPNYGQILVNLMRSNNLYRYDLVEAPPVPIPGPTPAPPMPPVARPDAPLASIDGIRVLQYALDLLGADPQLQLDGAFGMKTRSAVIAFQQHAGLDVDGDPGPKTCAAILAALNA